MKTTASRMIRPHWKLRIHPMARSDFSIDEWQFYAGWEIAPVFWMGQKQRQHRFIQPERTGVLPIF
jgi:hypothetical protein